MGSDGAREIIYNSSSTGRVCVRPHRDAAPGISCPADLEEFLSRTASAYGRGPREVFVTESDFELLSGCVLAMSPLRHATDDQLRAECSRRGIGHVSEPMCTVAERDEWKRRAEAAELANAAHVMATAPDRPSAALAAIGASDFAFNPEPRRASVTISGVTYADDDAHYVDPLDLLADDA